MLRQLLCLTLTLPAASQASRLLDDAWKVRSQAARELASAESVDVDALLQVLRTDWHGTVVTVGLYGGRGPGAIAFTDPRDRIRLGDSLAMMATGSWWHRGEPLVASGRELALPWHPHALALWLIERRATVGSRPDLTLPLTNDYQARAWLLLARPDTAEVRRKLADRTAGPLLAQALHTLDHHDALCDALAVGDTATRRHVLATARAKLVERDDCLAAAVDVMLHDDDDNCVANLAAYIQRRGARATEALVAAVEHARDQRARGRAFVLLCRYPVTASSQAVALQHIGDTDEHTRHRAVYLLGRAPLPATLRAAAAQQLFETIEQTDDADTRLLAFDALGQCGEGVADEQRGELRRMLDRPRWPTTRARVLGCLQQLGVAAEVPLQVREEVATERFPTTSTWLALADEGARAADALAKLLRRHQAGIDAAAVARRFAETAPEVVTRWLLGDDRKPNMLVAFFRTGVDRSLQPVALQALRALEPDSGITTRQLLTLLATAKQPTNGVLDWLTARDDVGDGADQVYAWMAERGDTWVPETWSKFAARNRRPTARMLELLAPMLRRGIGWELLADDDRAAAREACRGWLGETEDGDTTTRLIRVLAQLGATDDGDIELILSNLLGVDADRTLAMMRHAPTLPPRLRARVEELVDSDNGSIAHAARGVLREQFSR